MERNISSSKVLEFSDFLKAFTPPYNAPVSKGTTERVAHILHTLPNHPDFNDLRMRAIDIIGLVGYPTDELVSFLETTPEEKATMPLRIKAENWLKNPQQEAVNYFLPRFVENKFGYNASRQSGLVQAMVIGVERNPGDAGQYRIYFSRNQVENLGIKSVIKSLHLLKDHRTPILDNVVVHYFGENLPFWSLSFNSERMPSLAGSAVRVSPALAMQYDMHPGSLISIRKQ